MIKLPQKIVLISRVLITTVLAGFLISVTIQFLIPAMDYEPGAHDNLSSIQVLFIGIGVWAVALGVGILEGYLTWKRKKGRGIGDSGPDH